MFTAAKWIGATAGELGRLAEGPKTENQWDEYKERILSGEAADPTRRGSLLFRKDLTLSAPVKSAVLSIAGLGFYRVRINGVSPDEKRVFAPVVSDYARRVKYDDYEVAGLLHAGKNHICVEVGPGWFTGNPKYWGWQQTWYANPRLIAELEIELQDGTRERVATDGTWRIADGNVVFSCIYDGETHQDRPSASTE